MHRSSESIACLATALAKAQAELANPEKSLVATIRPNGPGEAERSFRYAPLSSGLDIVRKALGQHEIATVQTTAIDQTAGIASLTTLLAHSSGEWIASDWPVCAVSETTTPHRMGAALTYARRYALFTLVGIAGEDDIDAPDLEAPTPSAPTAAIPRPNSHGRLNGGQSIANRGGSKVVSHTTRLILDAETSATLRDRLVAELKNVPSSDDAAVWAHRTLGAKNSRSEPDARQVENAFRAKLAILEGVNEQPSAPTPSAPQRAPSALAQHPLRDAGAADVKAIDKSRLSHPEQRRVRDREHVKFVAMQTCLICGRRPADAHHLRFTQHRALGRKVSDEFTVPLCRGHHREAHRYGDEAAWWKNAGIDPTLAARALWLETHPLPRTPDKMGRESATSSAVVCIDLKKNTRRERPVNKRDPNDKTKPIGAVDSQ
jgi:hypothetical protein